MGLGTLRHLSRILPPDTAYYGIELPVKKPPIDQSPRESQTLELESEHRHFKLENILLSRMDGRRMAFRDRSFDEVHMHWMVTDLGIPLRDIYAMLQESARVLKSGGSCIITGEEKDTGYSDTLWMMREKHVPLTRDESVDALEKATIFSALVNDRFYRLAKYTPDSFAIVARKVD